MFLVYLLLLIPIQFIMHPTQPSQINFGQEKDGRNWRVILDGVMGGLSQGEAVLRENSIYFKGSVSLANNGGFASLKAPFDPIDLSKYSTLKIRLKSTGISFAFTLETERRFYMPNFKHSIQTESEDWETLTVPLADFKAYRLGRPMGKAVTKADLEKIIRIGIITNEKREEDFEVEVEWVRFE